MTRPQSGTLDRERIETKIRFPQELHARLRERALADRRSVNATVIVLLEAALDLREGSLIASAPEFAGGVIRGDDLSGCCHGTRTASGETAS